LILAETFIDKDLDGVSDFLKPLPILNKIVQARFLYPLNTKITTTLMPLIIEVAPTSEGRTIVIDKDC
jgi:hypothetical protein